MKCLEIIELRSINMNRELLESQLQKLIDEVAYKKRDQTIKLYTRALLDSDLSIHLVYESKKVEKDGSRLGLRLASALKTYGLINHRTWIEMQR